MKFIDILLDTSVQQSIESMPISDKNWIKSNLGIEWQLALGDHSSLPEFIDRYVYSFYDEARVNYLSRKPSKVSSTLTFFTFLVVTSTSDTLLVFTKAGILGVFTGLIAKIALRTLAVIGKYSGEK